MILTPAQQEAYALLVKTCPTVDDPSPMIGSACVMVKVTGESGCTVWFGIESDGYTRLAMGGGVIESDGYTNG